MPLASLLPALPYALGAFAALEVVYVLLRRASQRFRPRALYHLWALVVAALAGLLATPYARTGSLVWKWLDGAALVLSAVIGFALIEALVLVRPWDPRRGAFIPKLVRDLVRFALVAGAGLAVWHFVFGHPLDFTITSATSLAVVGLALQDILKNVFAGMSLQMERPFRAGDWLQIEGRGLAQVLDVSWRSTRLRTTEGVEIFEPNSTLTAARLVNYGSGREPVAFSFYVGLPYATPPTVAKQALLQAARTAPGAAEAPDHEAFVDHFGDSAVTYRLRAWTKQIASATRFQDSVQSRIWYQLQRAGIEVPFPIRTVQMHDSASEHAAASADERRRKTDLLAGLPLFRDLPRETCERLADAARRQVYDDGELLVREGETGDSLFVLERGRVQVTKSGSTVGTTYVVLARLKAGDFFGEMSLLTGEPRSATIAAEGSCEVLLLDRAAVAPVLAADPALAGTLSHSLAARTAATEATLEDRRGKASDEAPEQTLLHRIRAFFSLPDV